MKNSLIGFDAEGNFYHILTCSEIQVNEESMDRLKIAFFLLLTSIKILAKSGVKDSAKLRKLMDEVFDKKGDSV